MPRGNPDLAIAMGMRIAEQRKKLKLTQEQVAEKAGITYQQYNKAEKGKACVSSDTLLRISAALETSTDYLLSGKEWDHRYSDVNAILDEMTSHQRYYASEVLRNMLEFSKSETDGA